MDPEKNKKLQQYSVVLLEKAQQEEKSGKSEEAIKLYLKLVDVFLVLAAEAQDHNTWQQYIRQAEAYQARTRSLAGDQQVPRAETQNPNVAPNAEKEDTTKPNTLKKILKPFQRTDIEASAPTQRTEVRPTIPNAATPPALPPSSSTVSSELYQRVLQENKVLRDRISALTKEKEEEVAAAEKRNSELEVKMTEMVPRADYDALQAEFDNSVPRLEYDRVKSELLKSVPKSYYDELLSKVTEMVPKQAYLDAERRAIELEGLVRDSVPKKLIDDLASEVSLLGVLSEVPLEKPPEKKEEKIEVGV